MTANNSTDEARELALAAVVDDSGLSHTDKHWFRAGYDAARAEYERKILSATSPAEDP